MGKGEVDRAFVAAGWVNLDIRRPERVKLEDIETLVVDDDDVRLIQEEALDITPPPARSLRKMRGQRGA